MIKLIVFDLWKTLIYRGVDYSSTAKMVEELDIDIPKDEASKIFESTIQARQWTNEYSAYRELCKQFGLEQSDENIRMLMDIRNTAELKIKEYPHSRKMLQDLRKQGFKIGLLSNSSSFAVEKVEKSTDILKYMDYKVFSFTVGTIKPDFKMFEEILKIANCKPEETVMVGDNMRDDIEPAQKLGIKAILYEDYNQLQKDLGKIGISI